MSRPAVEPVRRRLADGREILYFDDAPGRVRLAVDRRALEPVAPSGPQGVVADLRGDPLTGAWTTVAAHRQSRTFLPAAADCPLCPTRDGRLTEIPESAIDVAVFENRFASFGGDGSGGGGGGESSVGAVDSAPEVWARAPAAGRCEVVVPTDVHDATTATLPVGRLRTMIDAWAHRSAELGARPEVAAVGVFENRGESVGVTLDHPHQQVYAFPFVPPATAVLQESFARHKAATGRCVVCDRLGAELAAESRIVTRSERWTALVPFAAKWPFEVNVVPHDHVRGLPDLDGEVRDDLAGLWRDLFGRYDALFDVPRLPTIAAWHQTPLSSLDGHLFAQVFTVQRAEGRLKFLAGSESAYGAWILDVPPERAAELLRRAR